LSKTPTLGEALFEVQGLVYAEVSALRKSNQEGDKEMAELLHNSMSIIWNFHNPTFNPRKGGFDAEVPN